MSNLNINRNISDPSDNDVFYTTNAAPALLKALAPLIWRIGLVFGAIWLLGIGVNSVWCSLEPYNCFSMGIVFGWLPILLIIFSLIGAFYFSGVAYQDTINRGYIPFNEPRIHRAMLEDPLNVDRVFSVAHQNVKSKATSGLDSLSPSTTWVSPKDKPIVLAQPEEHNTDDDDININPIAFEDLL